MGALAAVLAGTALLVDPGAQASFDAPKRLVALLGTGIAAAALVVLSRPDAHPAWSWHAASREQRVAVVLLGTALGATALSALLSPRRALSLDAFRVVLLLALLLPLGASRALEGRRSRALVWTFLAGCAVNAVLSALQASGAVEPFRGATLAGRNSTGGLVGNDGYLALLLALAAIVCLAVAVSTRSRLRLAAAAGAILYVSGLAVNQSLTAVMVLGAGCAVLAAALVRRRTVVLVAIGGLVAASALVAVSGRGREAVGAMETSDWDRLLSYRLGPWAAALEMARARPLVGWGPGTFGAEFVTHRLAAELRFHRRLVNPFLAGSYTEAHCDYLQALAEAGAPATLALLGALGAVLSGLVRRIRDRATPDRDESIAVLAVLVGGAAAALTWFPIERPISAVPLLLAAGRAWRLVGPAPREAGS